MRYTINKHKSYDFYQARCNGDVIGSTQRISDCLQCIWIHNGRNINEIFIYEDGEVRITTKSEGKC